jgi:hypothetical protein
MNTTSVGSVYLFCSTTPQNRKIKLDTRIEKKGKTVSNMKRIPKGSAKGGQFAPDPKSATSDLKIGKKKKTLTNEDTRIVKENNTIDKLHEAYKNVSHYVSSMSEEERVELLEEYDIDVEQLSSDIPESQIDEALEMISEARDNLRNNRYRPGSRDYDPGDVEGLVSDAFGLLGYEPKDAYSEGMKRLKGVEWEPSYDKYHF